MTQDEYQEYMDALAKRLGKLLDGENAWDAAAACGACAVYSIIEGGRNVEERAESMRKLIEFMAQIFSRTIERDYPGEEH